MADLIALLEASTEGSRELDGEIWRVSCPEEFAQRCDFKGMKHAGHVHTKAEKAAHVTRMAAMLSPTYTTSIDDALTLVPKGKWWIVGAGRLQIAEKLYGAFIYRADEFDQDGAPIAEGAGESASSAALALCIAALKAREPTTRDDLERAGA